MTASKPIWITEIGRLAPGDATPGAPQGRATAQARTASMVTQPLLTWLTANAIPGGRVPHFDAIAWFSTHACGWLATPAPGPNPTPGPPPTPGIQDLTASDLLDIGPVACPIPRGWTPPAQQRTVIGELWATATCPLCACPGPDCP